VVPARGMVNLLLLITSMVLSLSACATWRIEPTQPGPGVPIISNLRVEPEKVMVGEEVTLTFDFEDTDADIVEAQIYSSEVREWVYSIGAPTVVDVRNTTYGRGVGSIEVPFKWETDGVRIFEVFVVDERGHTSNKLRVKVTVTLQ